MDWSVGTLERRQWAGKGACALFLIGGKSAGAIQLASATLQHSPQQRYFLAEEGARPGKHVGGVFAG